MKRILLIVGTLNAGGLERFVSRVVRQAIATESFIPVVLCLTKREGIFLNELLAQGIRVLEAPSGWQKSWTKMRYLSQMIWKERPDIVHSQVNFSLVHQWLLYKLAGVRKIAFTERNCYPLSGWWRVRRMLQFYFIRLMGVSYSANSQQVRMHLSQMLWYPAGKIPVIPNGLEVKENHVSARGVARKKYNWGDADIIIGYVARMDPHKGHFYFLEVINHLQRLVGDVKFKICLVGDGILMPEIQKKVESSSLKDITILTGIISNMEELMPAFDLLCLFSEREGMPNVVIEAMAGGVPVFANPVGNVPELLGADAGFINTSSQAVHTAQFLNSIMQDKSLRLAAAEKSRQKIATTFSIELTFQQLLQYYLNL
ncbi:MAG: putative glycosyltransferase EpsF [Haliscomenobacter sp.]|nr:putative glycosyltransferase EpsF [Haliscomenobacter sp.]